MTTINTSDDLLRLLRENSDFRDAARRELLGEELLELPGKFNAFVDRQTELGNQLIQIVMALANNAGGTDGRLDVIERRLDGIDNRLDGIDGRLDGIDARFDAMDARLDSIDSNMDEIKHQQTVNTRHIGEMKNIFMVRTVGEHAPAIAYEMGLEAVRTLGRLDVAKLADAALRQGKAEGISRDDMRSFRRADVIMEGTDAQGNDCYIAVEISYSAAERDTYRAIRNAGYLTRFTGLPAYAVVASVHRDNEVKDVLTQEALPHGARATEKAHWAYVDEDEAVAR